MLTDKRVVVTGGTGSLGQALVRRLLEGDAGLPAEVVVFSRSEALQHDMRLSFLHRRVATDEIVYDEERHSRLRFRIGDVRDYEAVASVLDGADVVFHAAAMKQVPTCEYHPAEAIKTNVGGARNIVRAIAELGLEVEAIVGVSTDKACKPVNVMGMTKALQERILLEAGLALPGHPLRRRPVRQRDRLAGIGGAALRRADRHRRAGHDHDPGDDPLPAQPRPGGRHGLRGAARRQPGRDLRAAAAGGADRGAGPGADRRPRRRDRARRRAARREGARGARLRGGGAANGRARRPPGDRAAAARSCASRSPAASRSRDGSTAPPTRSSRPSASSSCCRRDEGRHRARDPARDHPPEQGDRGPRPGLRGDARAHRAELRPGAQRRLLRRARRPRPGPHARDRGRGVRRPRGRDPRRDRPGVRARATRSPARPRRHGQRHVGVRRQADGDHGPPHGGRQPLLRRPRPRGGQPPDHRPGQRRAPPLHRGQPGEPAARGLSPAPRADHGQPDQGGARRARRADRGVDGARPTSASSPAATCCSPCTARRPSTSTTGCGASWWRCARPPTGSACR